jgi:serine/threonine protein kinase
VAAGGSTIGDGRWTLRRRLGRGAFGTAWEAHDLDEDITVAVKLLKPTVRPSDVLREARLHRRLSEHPRIVTMRNVLVAATPSPFVVLDYMPSGSLDAVLAVRRPTVVEAQRWLRDTLEALAHAHGMNVLHRDVKPSNLLLGADGHALLTDFGVAEDSVRRAARAPGMYPLTLPPEFGSAPATEQTDLWLVGILGWQLLTGHRPDLAAAHAGRLELPHRASLEVPMALSRAVMEGLAPDPADRPDSAERMLERVRAVPIRCGWHDVAPVDPAIIRAWRADDAGRGVVVQIRRRTRDFEVTAAASPGARLQRRRRVVCATVAAANQQARRWLEQVVRGTPL